MKDTKRHEGLELLRILAMMGVVMNHIFNYGLHIYGETGNPFCIDTYDLGGYAIWTMLESMKLIALVSVNCFVLISGYFLIDKTETRLKGILKVWTQTFCYAVGIYAVCVLAGIEPFSFEACFEALTPVWHNSYWFVTSYLVLMAVAPFLSMMVQNVTQRQYITLLAVGAVVCLQPLLGQYCVDDQNVLLFIYLYLVGGYIKRYCDVQKVKAWMEAGAATACFLVMLLYAVLKNWRLGDHHFMIYAMYYHGMVLPFSICVFMLFRRLHLPSLLAKPILYIAPLTFAVYIIHTQSTMDRLIWTYVTDLLADVSPTLLPFYCTAICMAMFVAGISIEWCRQKIVETVNWKRK